VPVLGTIGFRETSETHGGFVFSQKVSVSVTVTVEEGVGWVDGVVTINTDALHAPEVSHTHTHTHIV
jgi:hypothetical protein